MLFADIVGFTTMSETRDPEHVKNLVDSWFARLATDVTSHGGRVDKTIGDALMAIFGAPVAHEDDAERAVRCALAMQRTVAELAASSDIAVRLRVGVNTGEVLIGAMRAGGDFTAMGDAVNVASRLQTFSEPGTVVVGPATYQATNGVIAYTELEPLQARNREEKVPCWRAEATLVMPGRRASQRKSPLVGRDNEVALLRAMMSTSLARSRPSVAVMFGEPGVGKTRLAEEVAEMARCEHDALVLEGRCVPYGEANVWWPIAEAVRDACGLSNDCSLSDDAVRVRLRERVADLTSLDPDDPELDRLVAGLIHVLGDPAALGDIDPARVPSEVRRAIEALIQGLARRQPLMIALAELHWADDVVLGLIDDLLERAIGLPVFVLATARPDLEKRWMPPAGRHNTVAIHLDPLDDEAAATMLSSLLGSEASQEMVRLVMERAGGNPLFLEELAGLLSDRSSGVSELPATLRGLVAARIDGLDQAARNILDDAAVIGSDGRVDALAALAQSRGQTLDEDALDELVARELLEEDAGAWSFRSALVREVAYDTLTKADRARRHAAIGVWLSERRRSLGREDDEYEPIAHHLSTAALLRQSLGDIQGVPTDITPRALGAIERAAMAAKDRGLHSGSIRLLDQALELLDPSDRLNRHRALLARASGYAAMHLVEKGTADVEAVAAELGEGDEDVACWAQVEMLRGDLRTHSGDTAGAITSLEHALELWRRLGDETAVAKTLRLMGMTYLFAGDNAAADQWLNEALAAYRALGDRRGEAWALQSRAWLSFNQGLLDEADERLHEAEKTFVDIGDYGGLGFVRGLLGYVRMFQGRFEEAGALAEKILNGERDRSDKWSLGMILNLLSSVKLFTGKPDEAIAPAREAIEVFTAIGDHDRVRQTQATLARSLVAVGRIDEAQAILREVFDEDSQSSIGFGVIPAAVASQLGDAELMQAALGRALDRNFTMGTVADHETEVLRGIYALLSGDSANARTLLQQSVDSASNEGQRAYAYGALAIATAAARDPKAALAAADKALGADGGTYLDAQMAKTGQALAFAQMDDRRALVVADDIVKRAGETTDVLTQATALLVRASVACALRTDDAVDQAADADQSLEELGAELPAWREVFAAAATPDARL